MQPGHHHSLVQAPVQSHHHHHQQRSKSSSNKQLTPTASSSKVYANNKVKKNGNKHPPDKKLPSPVNSRKPNLTAPQPLMTATVVIPQLEQPMYQQALMEENSSQPIKGNEIWVQTGLNLSRNCRNWVKFKTESKLVQTWAKFKAELRLKY